MENFWISMKTVVFIALLVGSTVLVAGDGDCNQPKNKSKLNEKLLNSCTHAYSLLNFNNSLWMNFFKPHDNKSVRPRLEISALPIH